MTEATKVVAKPQIMRLDISDLRYAFEMGWRDFCRRPGYGLFFSSFFVFGGWLILWALLAKGQIWWTIPAAAGFPILGPFIAVGLYEVSRRLEQNQPLIAREILGVVFHQKDGQIPSMAAMIVIYFLFWNFLSHMVFAVTLGTNAMVNVSSSIEMFLSPQGMLFLGLGTLAGAVFAALLFSLTVVALPMLIDREIDYVTAMLVSVDLVRENFVLMMGWGGFIAIMLFLAMIPACLGLLVVLPLFGHASWHLYRRAIE